MKKSVVSSDSAPAAVGPYSQAVRAGDLVFTSGQLGLIPGTKDFAGLDVESQTRQALRNLEGILKAAGSCLDHVLKCTVFLQDIGEFSRVNDIYAEFFVRSAPARSAVEVAALPLGACVEIEAIALLCDGTCECDE